MRDGCKVMHCGDRLESTEVKTNSNPELTESQRSGTVSPRSSVMLNDRV